MNILIVGGGLQGVEVSYLGLKTDWRLTLVDKKQNTPAELLAHQALQLDVFSTDFEKLILKHDLVIPALENAEALGHLVRLSQQSGVPLAFDPESYAISSSKILSKKLFQKIGVPTPGDYNFNPLESSWPQIAKPSEGSGSCGLKIMNNAEEYEAWAALKVFQNANWRQDWVIEEYFAGPTYSVEVTRNGSECRAWQTISLGMDTVYDCNKAWQPTDLTKSEMSAIGGMAETIAKSLNLKGLMDLEVIKGSKGFSALEIDARFPSQTPTAVFWASGINLVEELAACFVPIARTGKPFNKPQPVVYEHLSSMGGTLYSPGEGLMKKLGPLKLVDYFPEAEEALLGGTIGVEPWGVTLIFTGSDLSEIENKRHHCFERVKSFL